MVRRDEQQVQRSGRSVLVWCLLSLLMAATGTAIGYIVAIPAEVASAEPSVPRLLQVDDIYAAGLAEGRQESQRARFNQSRAGYRAGVSDGRKRTRRVFAERYERGGLAHRRIYAEGAEAGERRALARFGFGDAGFYIVAVVDGGRQVDASHGPLGQSESYGVCRDGSAVCVQPAP